MLAECDTWQTRRFFVGSPRVALNPPSLERERFLTAVTAEGALGEVIMQRLSFVLWGSSSSVSVTVFRKRKATFLKV